MKAGSGSGPGAVHFKQCLESQYTSFFKENGSDDLNSGKVAVKDSAPLILQTDISDIRGDPVRGMNLYRIRLDIPLFETLVQVEVQMF